MKENHPEPHPSGIIAVEDWQLLSRPERHLRVFHGVIEGGERVWGTATYASVSPGRPKFEVLPGCTYCHEDGTTIFLALDEATGLQLTLLHRAWLSLRAAMYAAARGSTERRDYEGALKELLFVASSEGIHGVLRAFAERLYDEELVPLMLKNLGGALFYDAVTDRVSFQPMKQL